MDVTFSLLVPQKFCFRFVCLEWTRTQQNVFGVMCEATATIPQIKRWVWRGLRDFQKCHVQWLEFHCVWSCLQSIEDAFPGWTFRFTWKMEYQRRLKIPLGFISLCPGLGFSCCGVSVAVHRNCHWHVPPFAHDASMCLKFFNHSLWRIPPHVLPCMNCRVAAPRLQTTWLQNCKILSVIFNSNWFFTESCITKENSTVESLVSYMRLLRHASILWLSVPLCLRALLYFFRLQFLLFILSERLCRKTFYMHLLANLGECYVTTQQVL